MFLKVVGLVAMLCFAYLSTLDMTRHHAAETREISATASNTTSTDHDVTYEGRA